ncbi:hypothetical protein ACFL1R_07540 [Candidatus Latescibacterota bacterium]
MIDLILTDPSEGPAALFTRNFRVHSGIPIGLYEGGPRSPVALVYGDVSPESLWQLNEHYSGIIALPSMKDDQVPDEPCHYETMTVKAPILATMQRIERKGFSSFVKTFEGGSLVLVGKTGEVLTLLFTADLIKATIRILSGELEQYTGTDDFGRPNPPPESVTYTPAVSLHFNLIENAIRYMFRQLGIPLLSIPRWPSSAPLALFLSHDVDRVRKWTAKRSVYEVLMGFSDLFRFRFKRLFNTIASIAEALKGRDPYWLFDELLFMENGNGFKSTWFFAPFGGEFNKRENDYDPIYHRRPVEITSMIRRIIDNDCELALHGTRLAFSSARELKRQLESFDNRLGFKLLGVRHHYLMFRHHQTLEAASDAGLLYDATLGFSDRVGFRNGMASPFFPYHTGTAAGNIVEIPLNFMDTVFIRGDNSIDQVMRRITETYLYTKAAGGLFGINIHPDNMDALEIPELNHFYQSLLSRFRLDSARSMTGIELTRWWISREMVLKTIEFGTDVWRIRGVVFPEEMDLLLSAPNIKNMRFSIEGAAGASELNHDTLTIRPKSVDTDLGITIIKKK